MTAPRAASVSALFGAAALLAGCQLAQPRSDAASQGVEAALRARVQSGYVEPFRSGDVQRWTDVFAQDALAYHDGPPPLKGREAIQRFGQIVHANFEIRQFDVVVDEVRTQGRWALTAGHFTANFVPRTGDAYAGAVGPRQGKFMFVWARQGGQWRIIADMGNSTDPPPAAASP